MKGTALSRSKRAGLLRNAALILGRRGTTEAVPALIDLLNDPDPTIRASAAWALGRIGTPEALLALEKHPGPVADPVPEHDAGAGSGVQHLGVETKTPAG